jgi:hypothetical protein
MTHDPKWEQHFYFDDYVSFNGLRSQQRVCGVDNVRYFGDLFIGDARKRLLSTISLFALVCGAGKTMLMVSTLQAINEQVKMRVHPAPRAGRVLWLVKERLLGVMLRHELQNEIVKYGLHHRNPEVAIYDTTGDIDMGPQHFDIVIACPHVFWETTISRRSDQDVATLLSKWDVIIWDECDFADEQTKRIASLAPHALKFGLTASPINADGELLKHFAIAQYATYEKVFNEDHCLKQLLPWDSAEEKGFVRKILHEDYDVLSGSKTIHLKGKHRDNRSLPGSVAAIRAAIIDCNALEQDMRRAWPEHWYSPHILVKCSSKAECEHLCQITNQQMPLLNLQGDGWRATAIYDGFANDKREERHLFHKDKNVIHPFMRAATKPELLGRCDKQSSRILFVVDMAVRGMNCWPLLYLVDIDRGASVNVQVQFKGRDGRWPKFLSDLHKNDLFEKFCTGRYYRPDSGGSSGEMQAAYDFIFNMEERIIEANLLDWERILQGESINHDWKITGMSPAFSAADQVQVDSRLGAIVQTGNQPTENDVTEIIASLPGDKNPGSDRVKRVKEHISNVLNDGPEGDQYRDQIRNPGFTVIKPVYHEEPKPIDQYSLAELITFAKDHPKWSGFNDVVIADIGSGNETTKKMVATELRERDTRLFHPVSNVTQLHAADGQPGIISAIRDRISAELYKRRIADPRKVKGDISKAVNTAVAMLCDVQGIPNATGNKGPLNRASYHHALMMPHNQGIIRKLTYSLLIKWNVLAEAAVLYEDGAEQSDAAE